MVNGLLHVLVAGRFLLYRSLVKQRIRRHGRGCDLRPESHVEEPAVCQADENSSSGGATSCARKISARRTKKGGEILQCASLITSTTGNNETINESDGVVWTRNNTSITSRPNSPMKHTLVSFISSFKTARAAPVRDCRPVDWMWVEGCIDFPPSTSNLTSRT